MKQTDGTIQTGTIGKDQKFVQYFLIGLFQVQLGGASIYNQVYLIDNELL